MRVPEYLSKNGGFTLERISGFGKFVGASPLLQNQSRAGKSRDIKKIMSPIHIVAVGEFQRFLSWKEALRYVEGRAEKELYENEYQKVEELLTKEEEI